MKIVCVVYEIEKRKIDRKIDIQPERQKDMKIVCVVYEKEKKKKNYRKNDIQKDRMT